MNMPQQTHTHEFLGSTKLAVEGNLRHNHRFSGVTSQAIHLSDGNHIHEIISNTDFVFDHLHQLTIETGPGIPICDGRHIHFVKGITTIGRGHRHEFVFATLIEDPLK